MPVPDEQSDLTDLPIFAPHATAVDQGHHPARGNGAPIASLPTIATTEQRPASLSASELTGEKIDWGLVRSFRKQAAEILSSELKDRSVDTEREREIGREIITRLLAEHVDAEVRGGGGAGLFTATEQDRMARALFDSLFGLGRLQALVDDDTIENIEVYGHDRVSLVYAGGLITSGPPVAESDDELIEQLQFLAGRAGVTGRPFSPADPQLDLRLHGGHRLAASAWTTPRPVLVIRRHPLVDVNLARLVTLGLLDTGCAAFLAACVRARKSIVVAGEQGAGKTTLLRALCNEIDPEEAIATIETEYELHLDQLPDRHPRVIAWEARPGNGQVGVDGSVAGEVTVAQLLYHAHRFNRARIIVGEVRGGEVTTMFQAMQAGAGSLSTIHARNAKSVVERLVTLAIASGNGGAEHAYRQVAHHIDLIVHITARDSRDDKGVLRRGRFISEVVAVDPGDGGRPALTDVYTTVDGTLRAGIAPRWLNELEHVGYHGGWATVNDSE